MTMAKRIVVIGAGPAGMMAAATAASRGADVTLLEKNQKVGRKLMITGKGRCNVTNACTNLTDLLENVPGNPRFLYGALSRFMPTDTMDWFEERGVPLKIERGNRVFPVSDKASDIVDAMALALRQTGVRTVFGAEAAAVTTANGQVTGVKTTDGHTYPADAVIVATGGVSYPLTGSTGDGYVFAKSVGHTVVPPHPSLVPLECKQTLWRKAQGLSLKNVGITVTDLQTRKEVYADFGELLFTHFGVSGPVILSASSHVRDMNERDYLLTIDLKPALDEKKLDARLVREFTAAPNKTLPNLLRALLPSSLIPVIVTLSGIDPTVQVNKITREQRQDLGYLLKHLESEIAGTLPVEEGIVTAGGVSTREVDPKTMQSRLISGLFFAGEVLDVDAYTGGFNLQIAFATGRAAAIGAV